MNAVPTYWFVVANSTRARVIAITGRQGQPTEIAAWVHPESRLHEQELTSDLPGRSFDSHGQGRHAVSARTSPKELEARHFAREIVERLDKARGDRVFDRLVLVAPPQFLGLLRKNLSAPMTKLIAAEVAKDLTTLEATRITKYLPWR